ncbi:MAG: hypothetical protein ACOC97_06130 [Myxococcota bacterium]
MAALRTLYEDDTLRVVVEGNMAVAVWTGAPSVDQLRRLHGGLNVLRSENPDGGAFMNVVVGGTPRFSNEVREEAARITQDTGPTDRGTAHVVLIEGMAGAAVRAFIGTMTLMGRPKIPTKTFGDLTSAADWLLARLEGIPGTAWSRESLIALAERALEGRRG